MLVERLIWYRNIGWAAPLRSLEQAQFGIFFGPRLILEQSDCVQQLQSAYPQTQFIGCSTSGQIFDDDVSDDVVTAMIMQFARTEVAVVSEAVDGKDNSFKTGAALGDKLTRADLRNVLVLSDGLNVNGSALIAGLRSTLADNVVITGGLAGDGGDFFKTVVMANNALTDRQVAAVGFYGDALIVGHGCVGGWDQFGPKRKITKSSSNVLAELDGTPALDLYKKYLGDEADGLPGSALLYPLLVSDPAVPSYSVVRTILAVDEDESKMTFAGDMPQGWSAQLMRGDFCRLAGGAAAAASAAMTGLPTSGSEIAAIMISCVGRRLLMGENIIDEVLAANSALGPGVKSVGFYSYGEISPHAVSGHCELHNQTMTVTTFAEGA